MRATALLALGMVAVATGCARPAVRADAPPPSPPRFGTVDTAGVSFRYPGGWTTFSMAKAPGTEGPQGPGDRATVSIPTDAPVLSAVIGIDDLDFVTVEVRVVTAPNPLAAWNETIARWENSITAGKAQFLARRQPITAAGLSGLGWGFRRQTAVGYVQDATLLVLLSGTREYSVLCQFTSQGAAQVKRGCQQIVNSLRLH